MTGYSAPGWLPGRHLQTILPGLWPWPTLSYARERWETPQGTDFIDVDWAGGTQAAPLLVLFHGLEGKSSGAYARRIGTAALHRGWRFAVPHFRGCSGEPNRELTDYHSGASREVDWILRRFAQTHERVYAAGVSLGANALLKWLGEEGPNAAQVVRGAVAISAPLDLTVTGAVLARGFSAFYGKYFLADNLRGKALDKLRRFPGAYDRRRVRKARVLRDFEDAVTAPVNGFLDAHDYWARSSASPFLDRIHVATLLINARNDPFLPDHVLRGAETRRAAGRIPPNVEFDFSEAGGHAGFADGAGWLGRRVTEFLAPL